MYLEQTCTKKLKWILNIAQISTLYRIESKAFEMLTASAPVLPVVFHSLKHYSAAAAARGRRAMAMLF